MLRSPTVEKLQALHLHGLLTAWEEQERHSQAAELAFAERLGLLVDAEWTARENRRQLQRLKTAKLKLPQACVEDLDYRTPRGLDKALVRGLATCQWLAGHQNLICVGPTGTGKTVPGVRLGPPGVPARLHGAVLPRAAPVPGARPRARRRQLSAAPGPARPDGPARDRRLGHRPADGCGATGLPRGDR